MISIEKISEKDLDKYIEIHTKYYPNISITREEALEDAYKLLDLLEILSKINTEDIE